MELELKHWYSYLDSDVKVYDTITKKAYVLTVDILARRIKNGTLSNLRLVLHGLSYLTKEIEVNGEKFVPQYRLGVNSQKLLMNPETVYPNKNKGLDLINHRDFQRLIEWHFDVFGLITEGLAIDINTLQE